MSRLDYSKWNHIELSDDEDIECHPNVDKKSFIKWRQQQIHEERAQRKHGIEQYKKQLTWLDQYIPLLEKFPDPDTETINQAHTLLSEFQNVPDNLQFTKVPNNFQAFEMFREHVKKHKQTIVKELDRLVEESHRKLAIDDLCTPGFESTRISKAAESSDSSTKPQTSTSSSSPKKIKSTTLETLNSDGVEQGKLKHAQDAAKKRKGPEDAFIHSEEALVFANWSNADYQGMYKYLRDNPNLVSSSIADEILASAFQAQMDGHPSKTVQYVHQAQVITFCVNLGQQGAPMFFSKITDPNHQATQLFKTDLERTLSHIQKRCAVLKAKASGKLKSVINLEPGEDRMRVFRDLPSDLQQALIAEDMDLVDAILAQKSEREQDQLRSKMTNAGILCDPSIVTAERTNEHVLNEDKLRLFKELPADFGKALMDGDIEVAQEILMQFDPSEQNRVLQICKDGGFLEFEEVEEEDGSDTEQGAVSSSETDKDMSAQLPIVD